MAKQIDINGLQEFKKKCDETYAKVGQGGTGGGTNVIANKIPSEEDVPRLNYLQVGDVNYAVTQNVFVTFVQMTPQQAEELLDELNNGAMPVLIDQSGESNFTLATYKSDMQTYIDIFYFSNTNTLLVRRLTIATGAWSKPTAVSQERYGFIMISNVNLFSTETQSSIGEIAMVVPQFIITLFGITEENIQEWWSQQKTSGEFGNILTAFMSYGVNITVKKDSGESGLMVSNDGAKLYAQLGATSEVFYYFSKDKEAWENSTINFMYMN